MFAGTYARLIMIAVIVMAVLSGVWYVKHLQGQVEELTAKNIVLTQEIANQNAAVDALKKDADARVAAGEAAVKAAKAETAKAKGRAVIIYKKPPSTPGNDCKSSLDLINEQAAVPPAPAASGDQ